MLKSQRVHVLLAIPLLLLGGAAAEPDARPANASADLNSRVAELKLDAVTPLAAAIDVMRETTHANIVVDWASLEDAGVKRDAPVRIHLWDVTLDQALRAVIAVADRDGLIAHEPQNGVIVIAARDKLRRGGRVVRVYDVRSILEDFLANHRRHAPATQPATGSAGTPAQAGAVAGLDEANDALVRLIRATVEPEGWRNQSWNDGFARAFAGRLVITQTPENHRKIADLLRKLREGGSKDGAALFGG